MRPRILIGSGVLLLAAGCGERESAPPFVAEPGFQLLTLEEFDSFEAGKGSGPMFTLENGIWRTQGLPVGYIYSRETYKNFTWRGEYRFPDAEQLDDPAAANTGFMVAINGEPKKWPYSLEVQGKYAEMATIKANGGAAEVELMVDDQESREKARRPPSEWNQLEIVCRDGAITTFINGVRVAGSAPHELQSGSLGLQAEGFLVEFRRLRIRRD